MGVWIVLIAATITALCTGLGVLPFLFLKKVNRGLLGFGNAFAAGLMAGASIGLTWEAYQLDLNRTLLGLGLGLVLIWAARFALPGEEHKGENLLGSEKNTDFQKILLIMFVMTVHSFAEGIGVGVSYGGREGFGNLISAAIAVHNIPEGLAIGLVMIPRGVSIARASLWSIFSSLPQPLMAIPAYLFVTAFAPLLPVGLGLAAGAMFYMVFAELLPEATENSGRTTVFSVFTLAAIAMIGFQFLLQ